MPLCPGFLMHEYASVSVRLVRYQNHYMCEYLPNFLTTIHFQGARIAQSV
jgi:hypothetical protein